MKRPTTLNPRFVESVTRPGKYGDGHGSGGLALVVKTRANGRVRKNWVQRVRVDGRITNLGLGTWPYVSLAMARQRAIENRQAIERGENPLVRKPAIPTLAEAAEIVIELHATTYKAGSKNPAQWRSSLRDYIYPTLRDRTVDEITTGDLLACLVSIWNDKNETARRLKQRLSLIFRWCIAEGHRADDPAGDALSAALPKNSKPKAHHKALAHSEIGAAIRTIRGTGAHWGTISCFELLALTATRSGECRLADFREIDFEAATWEIPGKRTKTGRPHRVPLSDQAVELLAEARERTGGAGMIFPSPTGRPMSDSTISKLVRESGLQFVPHGLRSSFRQWCADTGKDRELAEMALGHAVRGVEGAYQRSDVIDRRRLLMQSWADYLARKPADVVKLRA